MKFRTQKKRADHCYVCLSCSFMIVSFCFQYAAQFEVAQFCLTIPHAANVQESMGPWHYAVCDLLCMMEERCLSYVAWCWMCFMLWSSQDWMSCKFSSFATGPWLICIGARLCCVKDIKSSFFLFHYSEAMNILRQDIGCQTLAWQISKENFIYLILAAFARVGPQDHTTLSSVSWQMVPGSVALVFMVEPSILHSTIILGIRNWVTKGSFNNTKNVVQSLTLHSSTFFGQLGLGKDPWRQQYQHGYSSWRPWWTIMREKNT